LYFAYRDKKVVGVFCAFFQVALLPPAAVFQAFPQVWPDTKLDSMMMIVAKRNIYNPRRELL
jgi:hypothetical protein